MGVKFWYNRFIIDEVKLLFALQTFLDVGCMAAVVHPIASYEVMRKEAII